MKFQDWLNWLRNWLPFQNRGMPRRGANRRRRGPLGLEVLETRMAPTVSNVALQADIVVGSAANQYAGLVARHSGVGDSNMYFGEILSTGSGWSSRIYKNVNGAWSSLSTAPVPTSLTGAGTLFFDVSGSSLKLYYGPTGTTTPTLLTYAFDSTFTTGTTGCRVANGATSLTNLITTNIPAPATPTLPFCDSFANPGTLYTIAASSGQLDANWVESKGNFNIASGDAVAQAAGTNLAVAALVSPVKDVSISAIVATSAIGQYVGLSARASTSTGNFYVGRIKQISATQVQASILKFVNGSWRTIPGVVGLNVNAGIGAADDLTFDAEGGSLKLFLNGSLIAYAHDSTLTSGSVGIYTYGRATVESGFSATVITSGNSLSFSDSFIGSPGNQLNPASWVEQAGNFNLSAGAAVGTASGSNVASVQLSSPATSASVQASVTLTALNQMVGLTTRVSSAGNSYYVGRIQQISATQVRATIYRYTGGHPVQIGTSKTINGVNIGVTQVLRFEASGSALSLFVNNILATTAIDTCFESGTVGMYIYGAAGAARIANYSATTMIPGTLARLDTTNLTVPVAGTIHLTYTTSYPWELGDAPYPTNTNITAMVIVIDGAEVALAGGSGVSSQFAALIPSLVTSRPGNLYQVDITLDTTQLAIGSHFIFLSAYTWDLDTTSYPVAQMRTDFTVANASSPSYSGTNALVNPPAAGTYPHFGSDGSILQTYNASSSVLPISVFASGVGNPTAADLAAAGLNQATIGFFANPNDNGGWRNTNLDAWKAAQATYYDMQVAPFAGLLIHLIGDDLIRSNAEKEFIANCPWAFEAITYAASLLGPDALTVDMVDEVYAVLGSTPTPTTTPPQFTGTWNGHAFTLPLNVVSQVRAAMLAGAPNLKMTWAVSANSPAAEAATWALWGAPGVSDYTDIYFAENSFRHAYGTQSSLFDRAQNATATENAVFATMQRQAPWIAESDLASESPTYPVSSSGPEVAGLLMHQILIQGAAGARIYSWDPAYPNWSTVLGAISAVNPWLQAHRADIFQGMLNAPNAGPWIESSLRDGATSTMLTFLNLADVPLPMNYDNSAVFGGQTLTRYLISSNGVTSSIISSGTDSLVLAPNQTVVYVYTKP
jgi:hypothetical protein